MCGLGTTSWICLLDIPSSGIAWLHGSSTWVSLCTSMLFFYNVCGNLNLHQYHTSLMVSASLLVFYYCCFFLMIIILTGVMWYLIVGLFLWWLVILNTVFFTCPSLFSISFLSFYTHTHMQYILFRSFFCFKIRLFGYLIFFLFSVKLLWVSFKHINIQNSLV